MYATDNISNIPNTKEVSRNTFIPVDSWNPSNPSDIIITCRPGFFIVPVSRFLNIENDNNGNLDYFILSIKKCYNSVTMRDHFYRYINYFCKYYDTDFEYISIISCLKLKIDRLDSNQYPLEMFFQDLERYILRSNIAIKVNRMVEDNYYQELSYNTNKTNLQYTVDHAKILHNISMMINLCIPLLLSYAYMHKVSESIDEILLSFYDRILYLRNDVDIYSKLYETAYSNTVISEKRDALIWNKQDIRSLDTTTHSTDSVNNILLNIIPKYTFDKNIIHFNSASIRRNTGYKVTDIAYEYSFYSLSSSRRDEDSISDFDKFESNLIRMNEGLYLQNKINGKVCMRNIEAQYGPFDYNEIQHYSNRILVDSKGGYSIDSFQKQLIFDLFYKWFRDTESIHAINRDDYIKLVIAAKKELISKNMVILPYIISGKVEKLVKRKSVNKKERLMIMSSPSFPHIIEKYKNDRIIDHILGIIATIISSTFSIVDIDPEIDGKIIDTNLVGAIIEEVETFILIC